MKRAGCFGLIIVALVAVIGYQQWRIHQLETKIAAISTKVNSAKGSKAASQNKDLAKTLAQAQEYTRRAQEFLESKNIKQAQEQLGKARQKLEKADLFAKNIYSNSADFLGQAKTRTEKVFKQAWKDISTKRKPDSESAAKQPPPDKKQSRP